MILNAKFLNIKQFILILTFFMATLLPIKAEKITKIIATVNGAEIISSYDIEQYKIIYKYFEPTKKLTNQEVLSKAIEDIVIANEAKKYNINADKTQIDKYIEKMESQGISVEKIKQEGKVSDDFLLNYIKTTVKKEIFIQYIVSSNVVVSDEEIAREINRISNLNGVPAFLLAEIFIKDKKDTNEALNKIQQASSKVKNGAPFKDIALKYSESISAENGGDIGWVLSSQLTENQIQSITKAGLGKVTEPIKVQNGYIIYLVKDQKTDVTFNPNDTSVATMIQNAARQNIYLQKADLYIKGYIENLKNKSTIEIR